MRWPTQDYGEVYRNLPWAYGDRPDPELIRALANHPRGKALDLAGGQGRHAIALAALGFDAVLVDSVTDGLHQAAAAAEKRDLSIHVVNTDAAKFEPDSGFQVIVAALFFHIPGRRTALQIAKRMGDALEPGGLIYLSMPFYDKEREELVNDLMTSSGCEKLWITKVVVTKKDRPKLKIPRRNETRALGRRGPKGMKRR